MKKFTYLIGAMLVSSTVHAQLFSDNFDAYTTGALGPQSTSWTTWSGTEGGTEDGTVSSAQANSGTKSIYFNSTASGGGPQDCVLDFGPLYNTGVFTFSADFYVNTGKSAYFNFQGSQTIGQTWALNVNMDTQGNLTIDDGITAELAMSSYTPASWFTLTIEANLSLGLWEAFIDGNSIGVWQNGVNALASLDLFPLQGSQFYVDDVSFDHQTYTLMNLNAAVAGFDIGGNIATQTVSPTVTILNAGTTAITSFDVTLDYNGIPVTQNITGQNIASLADYTVTFPGIVLAPGTNIASATITNINGGADDDITDNTASITVNPVVPAIGKMVVGEEGTGTWCQWCPRGAVYMDLFETEYPEFWAGIAVHNADPMTVTAYDAGMANLIGGYPSALVDRGTDVDPSGMGPDFYARLQTAPVAVIENGATWDAVNRILQVSVTADFQTAANNNFKIACVLTEDGVTGTGAGWSQSNAYAGGTNGVMGGYESLPNPVPAATMVYDHVARAISPSFGGYTNSFPATVNSGDIHTLNFTFNIPAGWDENSLHIIGLLIAPNGRIDNAGKATITEAVTNGFVSGTQVGAGVQEFDQVDATFQIYPNPASSYTSVLINLQKEADVSLKLIDMSGKTMSSRNFGSMNGASSVELNTSNLEAGVYVVELTVNNEKMVKRLIIE
ncbi:MAG: Omp28-related outer membrane protein [Flavobacteriia bacterium]|jgi:hypothetical protein